MGLLVGLIVVAIFLGFFFSPKGTDSQTSVRNGCLYLSVLIVGLSVIGGIMTGIAESQPKKTREQKMKEYVMKNKDALIENSKIKRAKRKTKKVAKMLKAGIEGIPEKWVDTTNEYSFYFDVIIENNEVIFSKYSYFSNVELIYKVKGELNTNKYGYTLNFKNNDNLTGSLKYYYKSENLSGKLIENKKPKSFHLEKLDN